MDFVNHTLVTLEFEDVQALELQGFGPQNVLDDLVLEAVHLSPPNDSRHARRLSIRERVSPSA